MMKYMLWAVEPNDCDHKCCIVWYRDGIRRLKCLECGAVI